MKVAALIAILGIVVSAIISQSFNFGLIALDSSAASQFTRRMLSLAGTISFSGGLLIFFLAFLFKQK